MQARKERYKKSINYNKRPKQAPLHGWNPFARSMLVFNLSSSHFEQLTVRPILSATKTYNYSLAKWLDDKLKLLSCNQYTVIDTFRFADEVRGLEIKNGEILVSYDVTSLFTNVPLEETDPS